MKTNPTNSSLNPLWGRQIGFPEGTGLRTIPRVAHVPAIGLRKGYVAMYFKVRPLWFGMYRPEELAYHTNNWEILAALRILSDAGYAIDIIDRDEDNWRPQGRKYDLFIGLGVGNAGKHFAR